MLIVKVWAPNFKRLT